MGRLTDWLGLSGAGNEVALRNSEGMDEYRFGFQNWVDIMSGFDQYTPLVNTTMGTIETEELSRGSGGAVVNNSPVFALTLARMQVFSQIRFQWTTFEKGQPSKLFGSPELALLERPWAGGVTGDLLARMELDVTKAGNAYIRRTSSTRLNRLRPECVTIVMGSTEDVDHPSQAADVEVAGYVYHPNGNRNDFDRAIYLTPQELAHYAPIPDPDHHFLGMSWIRPAMGDVMADDASAIHKRKFFQNAATPNLAIVFNEKMTIDDVRQFKELFEEEHKGVLNAYKTLFLGGGADTKTVGKDFKELDFAVTQGKGESRLASCAGVPPSWVGFSEGLQGSALNAGNFASARRRFGDGTMAHLWGNAASSLEPILRKPPGSNVALWYDTTGIPFLREDSKDAAAIQMQEAGVIANLIREGFEAKSVTDAVQAHDWDLLVHTGRVSVQLQDPNAPAPAPVVPADTNPPDPAADPAAGA
jgi:phage portal protein BeeE